MDLLSPDWSKDQDFIWAVLNTRDRDFIISEFGSVMNGISRGLRGMITASPGHQLYVADYNAIESRVILWLAKDEEGLAIFREGRDIYNEMATSIFGRPINRKKPEHEKEGKVGKEAVLGLGFQMGAAKFVDRLEQQVGIVMPEDVYCADCSEGWGKHKYEDHAFNFRDGDEQVMTGVRVVETYRTKFWRVKAMWKEQEEGAIKAVKFGRAVPAGRVWWEMQGAFLYCTLPSGRRLAYPEPALQDREMPWGAVKTGLTYKGIDQKTRKWKRQHSYGGMLTENITQAVARDLMAEAMVRCAKGSTYFPILSVHDELIAEAKKGTGNVSEFESILAALPKWAAGCPVKAEGWTGIRYRK